jgi:hypothetical protein
MKIIYTYDLAMAVLLTEYHIVTQTTCSRDIQGDYFTIKLTLNPQRLFYNFTLFYSFILTLEIDVCIYQDSDMQRTGFNYYYYRNNVLAKHNSPCGWGCPKVLMHQKCITVYPCVVARGDE